MKKVYRLGVFLAILSLLLVGCLGGGSKNYAISGVVTDENGTGIAGVKLALEGKKTSLIVETTEDGSWGASGLQGSVKVTPSKEGWVFEPSSKEVSKESKNVDFRGSDLDQEYSISGLVADALGIGIADVKIDLKGDDFSLVVHTTEDGSWSAKDLKGQITVEPHIPLNSTPL